MKVRQWITGIVLLVLVAAAVVGVVWTRESGSAETQAAGQGSAGSSSAGNGSGASSAQRQAAARRALVDQRPLQTARRLAASAGTVEEQALAHAAEKTGDHELDLAFFDALRTAEENPPPLSPEAKVLAERKNKAELAAKDDQENIAQLTRRLAAAPVAQKDNLQDQIDVAKAQADLDQDELDDASEDLEQAGGDPQAKIKRLKEEHEASDHDASHAGSAVNPYEQDYQARTLLAAYRAWRALDEKRALIGDARQEATDKELRLNTRHSALAKQVEQDKENRETAQQQAKGFSQRNKTAEREESKASAQAALGSLKQYARDQRNLADLGRRMQDEQELRDVYGSWETLVETRERSALHHVLEALLWILVVALVVYLGNRLIDHLFTGMTAENKRIETLRTVVKFAAEAVGAIVVVFMVFGMPSQVTTVLGLAGAGLTVAMKDFIVAFFGWFILMGRNGIRVGDWVEINGVGGEVVEIGLLKTVLLETGSWSDAGHPTGRKVSFVNSFAIEGHFFNFSTSGQWMWDELQVLIPTGQDPYPVIDGIQKLVEKETEANARKAEEEWQSATTRYRVQAISAAPGINVQPTAAGIEVRVRYITRAYERHEARKRLYEAVVELMHGKREAVKG
ncbi:MAG TPA: mechanosensitive ion channel domain-containing protein [Candidatus Sulfotelmatobacter sp.]|nr:mechanosensitive ion channel domain-containing protein [Candidatus Sulfotelmatobacter sp.]